MRTPRNALPTAPAPPAPPPNGPPRTGSRRTGSPATGSAGPALGGPALGGPALRRARLRIALRLVERWLVPPRVRRPRPVRSGWAGTDRARRERSGIGRTGRRPVPGRVVAGSLERTSARGPMVRGGAARSTRSELTVVAANTTSSSDRRSSVSSVIRMPCPTSRAFSSAGSAARTTSRSPGPLAQVAVEDADRPLRVGRAQHHRPGRRPQRGQRVLQHQPAAVDHADPRAQVLDLGEQVAGQEDRRAGGRLSSSSSWRISWMPRGSSPLVGSSRMSSSGLRIRAAAMPSRCRMPSEYALTGRRPTPASPTCCSASSMRALRVRRDAARPGRVHDRQVRPRAEVPVRGRRLDQRPDPVQHRAGVLGDRARRAPRPCRRWAAPARAASVRSSSCRSRSGRGSRRCRRAGRPGRSRRPR